MSESLLTKEERAPIEGHFKIREYRLLSYDLMNWDHEHDLREQDTCVEVRI